MKNTIKMLCTVWLMAALTMQAQAEEVVWYDGSHAITCHVQKDCEPVVGVAMDMFAADMKAVTGRAAVATADWRKATIRVVEQDRAPRAELNRLASAGVPLGNLAAKTDGFYIAVSNGQILVVGKNGRGAAYGLLELSRMAGVSPWIWWGDVVPEHRDRLTIDSHFSTLQGASVEWRGVFINDEDWSLRPWSYLNYDKAKPGMIGSRTYKRIFQLLLRLRANAIWPAMHTGTTAFFRTPGAKAVADSCGIAIGSSHCEPLLRNNVDEWDVAERGRYNYISNRKAVQDYWAERLREVKGSQGGNMFTIGMRGIHDGSMEGVSTMQEKTAALQQVIDDQQQLIAKYIGDPKRQMQVFIPYKEVLQIYEQGLRVPDWVTLMWCDDNYGYMTRLSNAEEQRRSGGGGVYYHLSYWGRPHDYLWLCTMQPGLVCSEMHAAYDHNVRKLWIVNVHDPKVAGYGLELFLDMAWNINSVSPDNVADHYHAWLRRQFGTAAGDRLFPTMLKFYQLTAMRHPEFMGWSQVELDKSRYDRGLSQVRNTELTNAFGDELDRYLENFAAVAKGVKDAEETIDPRLSDAYFAAIEYPVMAAEAHVRKMLWAQKARLYANGSTLSDRQDNEDKMRLACAESQSAYQEIRLLTQRYNEQMAGGKWNHSMCMMPRDLPVFAAPVLPMQLTDAEVSRWLNSTGDTPATHQVDADGTVARNASDYQKASAGTQTVQMLGHSMSAVALPKGGYLTYNFTTDRTGDAELRVALIPTQPNDGGDLRFSVSVDGAEPTVYSLKEPFRSEQWKLNVLRGQALRSLQLKSLGAGSHTLTIRAIDDHIVVDQWMVDYQPERKFYLFPVG